MNLYRSHGISNSQKDMCPMPDDEIWRYQQIHLGYNYRMTDIQAALGLSQLKRLDQFIRRRHKIAERYNHAFEEIPIIIPKQCHNTRSSYHLYPIRIRRSLCNKTQRQLFNLMWSNGIGVNLHYIPVYLQPYYKKLGFHSGYCPEAELYHKEVITLPIFFSLEVSFFPL